MTTVYQDERPIQSITHAIDKRLYAWEVGQCGVTSIEPYRENHGTDSVLWFKVWKGDILIARINGKYIDTICYEGY